MPIKRGTPAGYRKAIIPVADLRRILRRGRLKFRFQKINGTLRIAFGTQLLSEIPQEDWPKNPGTSSPKVATFYDLKKGAWRSVSKRGDHVHIAIKQTMQGGVPVEAMENRYRRGIKRRVLANQK